MINVAPNRIFLNFENTIGIRNLQAEDQLLKDIVQLQLVQVEIMSQMIQETNAEYDNLVRATTALEDELQTSMWDNTVNRQLKIQFLREKDDLKLNIALLEQELCAVKNKN